MFKLVNTHRFAVSVWLQLPDISFYRHFFGMPLFPTVRTNDVLPVYAFCFMLKKDSAKNGAMKSAY
ncbi:MAG: hypothetical protein GKR88_20870 [Flavobacteriaceae bacterium]|nr:MAG: hypothetical protein GKR88_20870 [Flavobacteriaceae bacterium]